MHKTAVRSAEVFSMTFDSRSSNQMSLVPDQPAGRGNTLSTHAGARVTGNVCYMLLFMGKISRHNNNLKQIDARGH